DLTVLKGPEHGSEQANEFRQFWGERCELRRFPDGSILESVVWNADRTNEKRLVWMDATRYLLQMHAGISIQHVTFSDTNLMQILTLPFRLFSSYGSGDEQQLLICSQLIELSKQLRSLNELPLKIMSISGTSESVRYTDVFPPLPANFLTNLKKLRSVQRHGKFYTPRMDSRYSPPYTKSIDVLCQLEMSQKWFDDIDYIKHSKTLYYIQLATLLEQKYHYTCVPTKTCCYVLKQYYVYRLTIGYNKEIYLHETLNNKNDLIRSIKQTTESKHLRYETEYMPKLSAAIYGVSQQYVHYQSV
ncbi:unnamed protein product, partial [Didymodactylos carnosus]